MHHNYVGKLVKINLFDNLILSNNNRIFSCTHKDHLNDKNDVSFGDAEATILHEMIHSLGFPAKCSTNNKFFSD